MLQYAHLPATRHENGEYLASCNLERKHSSLDHHSRNKRSGSSGRENVKTMT